MIWAYLIHLGEAMWGDFEPDDGGACIFTDRSSFDMNVWLDVTADLERSKSCNMILIDAGTVLSMK